MDGGDGRSRTCDLQIRNLTRYPSTLHPQISGPGRENRTPFVLFPKQVPDANRLDPDKVMVGKESIELSSSGFSDRRSDLISYNPKNFYQERRSRTS